DHRVNCLMQVVGRGINLPNMLDRGVVFKDLVKGRTEASARTVICVDNARRVELESPMRIQGKQAPLHGVGEGRAEIVRVRVCKTMGSGRPRDPRNLKTMRGRGRGQWGGAGEVAKHDHRGTLVYLLGKVPRRFRIIAIIKGQELQRLSVYASLLVHSLEVELH